MGQPPPTNRRPIGAAAIMACVLSVWNGLLGLYGNPLTMTNRYDGTQYHLLVRNRLQGRYELDDTTHTVRRQGQHPMWRPGLVWVEEAIAPAAGSVGRAAVIASVVGTTLHELAILLLAYIAFGGWAAWAAFGLLLLIPLSVSSCFALMARSRGPPRHSSSESRSSWRRSGGPIPPAPSRRAWPRD